MEMMRLGHVAICKIFKEYDQWHMAWGKLPAGQSEWTDNPPQIGNNLTELEGEVGRKQYTIKEYVKIDPEGTLEIEGVKYSVSEEPTSLLHIRYEFSAQDHTTDTLYQVATFLGTKTNPAMNAVRTTVSNAGGYPVGATKIKVGGVTAGALEDLTPDQDLTPNGGRWIEIGTNKVRVKHVDISSSTLTVTPLTSSVTNGTSVSASATEAVPANTTYLTPDMILDPGYIFAGENRPPMFRSFSTKEAFDTIMSL